MKANTTSAWSYFYGLPNAGATAYFAAKNYVNKQQPLIYLTNQDPADFIRSLPAFTTQKTLLLFAQHTAGQMAVLYQLLTCKGSYVLAANYEQYHTPLPDRQEFLNRILTLTRGSILRRSELIDKLEQNGYNRQDYTENVGQYALRGSVVDIFSPQQQKPLRIYFAGNRIDSISSFDTDTQHTTAHQDQAVILPLAFTSQPAALHDYTKHALFLLDNPPDKFDICADAPATVISPFAIPNGQDAGFKAPVSFRANFQLLNQEAASLQKKGIRPVITCLNRGELDRLSELIRDYESLKSLPLLISPLTHGFYYPAEKTAYITSAEIFNRRFYSGRILKNFTLENAQRVRFKELRPGDYVVHQQHGIGKYMGLQIMDPDHNPTDCLIIEYRRGSKLYVPMYDFKRVQKYIGTGARAPALSALGGAAWKDIKQRVKEEAQKTAQEILQLEAKRQAAGTPALLGDERIEQEFADSFPYILTAGQTQAIEEILHDLSQARCMDRVLVGDVGFGKTEVAMRAALRAVMSGKQVMMLVPTTILADQHFKTFTQRMAGFPINIQMLCRFQTRAEQKETVQQIKSGICDIIIGTHRLLSKDIVLKDLGLIIIDEEHRFGVKQKEKIKAKCAGVHTLMLSATPIPRTLNQSLSSLRDISLIDTPPRGRTPIQTVVTAWDNELAGAAITQELARGGQVYYVYNSVQSMQSRYLFLKQLVPQARICLAHGQLKESELEQTLWDFNQGKYDILLASTIIESGLDITNANTLIVENAQNFGLAQLYQLRGRIGRGAAKAYCYLFYPEGLFKKAAAAPEDTYTQLLAMPRYKLSSDKDPAEEAKKRLTALMEFSELGSGFKLALRDMEIRGAGQLLGVKQHGHAHDVGLSLYCDLIASEVKKLKGQPVKRDVQASINLPVAAYIPPDYLPDDSQRLKTYKELMSADPARAQQILQRLADWAGPVPPQLTALSQVCQLSRRAGKLDIYHIEYTNNQLEFLFSKHFQMPPQLPLELLKQYGARLQFIKSRHGDGVRLAIDPHAEPVAETGRILTFFEHIVKPKML